MPLDLAARLQGATGASTLALTGHLANDLAAVLLVSGTLGNPLQVSYGAPVLRTGWRARLHGQWVDPARLGPVLTLEADLDSHLRQASLELQGREWSPFRTLTSWARTSPWEIFFYTGLPSQELEEKQLHGFPMPSQSYRANEFDLSGQLSLGDSALLVDETELCLEVPPLSGLTRGEIIRAAASAVGIPRVDVPDGAIYQGPISVSGRRFYDWLAEFSLPEGWYWRTRPADDTLEAYTADLKEAPLAADAVWSLGDLESLELSTPQSPANQFVVRGFRTVHGTGNTTVEIQRTEVRSLYAPEVAAFRQQVDGSQTPTGFDSGPQVLRLTSVVEVETTKEGNRLTRQVTRQWGFHNPAAGALRTPGSSEPDGPQDGYYPTQVYLTANGEPVAYQREQFVQTGESIVVPSYDAAGSVTGQLEYLYRWHVIPHGVKNQHGLWEPVVLVGGDGGSYVKADAVTNRVEFYGLAQQTQLAMTYGPSGAVLSELNRQTAYVSIEAALGSDGAWELANGKAQLGKQADFGLASEQQVINTLSSSGNLAGTLRTLKGYRALRRASGPFDYGDSQSSEAQAKFRVVETESISYTVLSANTYEQVTTGADGIPKRDLKQGQPPLPRYQASVWTQLQRQPVEWILDCPALADLFGARSQVLSTDYIQSLEEAEAVARRLHRRAASHTLTVSRAAAPVADGQTVEISHGIAHLAQRALLVACTQRRDAETGEATGTYRLEVEAL